MKKFKLFAYAAMAGLTLSFAACSEDNTGENGEQVIRGEKCRIESFTLNLAEGETLSGDVYDYDKSVDLSYIITQYLAMQSATATVKLSEGATISPDPSIAADYTQPVSFTITGADGKTTRTYTTKPVEKIVETITKISALTDKSAADMGIGAFATYKLMGISGNNLVINTKVFNRKTLAAVGDLNMTNVEAGAGTPGVISWMGNDEAGHLVCAVTPTGKYSDSGHTPGSFYCWKNGYDQPAELILGPSTSAIGGFVSIGGDLTSGKALITAIGGRAATGSHFCWGYTDGARTDYYSALNTQRPSNDGSWIQQVCPVSGDISGVWFMWDSVGGGSKVYTWSGWDGAGAINLTEIPGVINSGWGNYSKGSIKAFSFNDTPFAMVASTGWPCTYVSMVDNSGNFLLNPADATIPAAISDANAYCPIVTYIYDSTDRCGYAYLLVPGFSVKVWKLEVAIL